MALITCPECGKKISDAASSCPNCGYPVAKIGNRNADALLTRAFLSLEDGEWEEADAFIEQALNMEPTNAKAYLAKLMVGEHVHVVSDLGKLDEPFNENRYYSKIIRFADDELKKEVEGYLASIEKRKEETEASAIYSDCRKAMEAAENEEEYLLTADKFDAISKYKDAKELAQQCRTKAEECKKEDAYEKATELLKEGSIESYGKAISLLQTIPGWKDSNALIEKYSATVSAMEAEQEANRIEAEKKAEEVRLAEEKRTEAQRLEQAKKDEIERRERAKREETERLQQRIQEEKARFEEQRRSERRWLASERGEDFGKQKNEKEKEAENVKKEQEKLPAEEKKEKPAKADSQQKTNKKPVKKIAAIGIGVVVIVLAVVGALYFHAKSEYNSGNYVAAMDDFKSLGNLLDSRDYYFKSMSSALESSVEQNDYDSVKNTVQHIVQNDNSEDVYRLLYKIGDECTEDYQEISKYYIFDELGNYLDADSLAARAKAKANTWVLLQIKSLREQGKYEEGEHFADEYIAKGFENSGIAIFKNLCKNEKWFYSEPGASLTFGHWKDDEEQSLTWRVIANQNNQLLLVLDEELEDSGLKNNVSKLNDMIQDDFKFTEDGLSLKEISYVASGVEVTAKSYAVPTSMILNGRITLTDWDTEELANIVGNNAGVRPVICVDVVDRRYQYADYLSKIGDIENAEKEYSALSNTEGRSVSFTNALTSTTGDGLSKENAAKYIKVDSIKYKKENGNAIFTLHLESEKNCSLMAFNPPDGTVYKRYSSVTAGNPIARVVIPYNSLKESSELTMGFFGTGDLGQFSGFVYMPTYQFN